MELKLVFCSQYMQTHWGCEGQETVFRASEFVMKVDADIVKWESYT